MSETDNIMGDMLLTPQEVAKILRIRRINTIYEWLRSGELQGTRIGKGSKSSWRIWRKDLMSFITKANFKQEG